MFYNLIAYGVYVVAWLVCGLALWKGDTPLRLTAAVTIFLWTITPLVGSWVGRWNSTGAVVDTAGLMVMGWISFRWRTLWSAAIVALCVLQVILPLVAVADPTISIFVMLSAYAVLGYGLIVVIAVATWQVVRARRRADEGAVRA